jgi:hypothetical protein
MSNQPQNEIDAKAYVLSIGIESANKKHDRICDRGKRKFMAYREQYPDNVWYGETGFDFLSDAEKTMLHKLRIGLQLTDTTSKEEIRSRIIARRKARREQRLNDKSTKVAE